MSNQQEFKQTEIGRIPKRWEVVRVGDRISLEYGKGLIESERKNGEYFVFGSNGIVGYHNDFLVRGPGIVVGRKGTIGAINWSEDNFWPIDTTYFVRVIGNDVDLRWLYYKLTSLSLSKLNMATGTPGLNRDLVYKQVIPLPSLPEQKKIAEILTTVDQGIEKVDEAIQRTQRLKKGLMQELLTRGIGHKEFKGTEIGRIPEDWKITRLGEIGELERGKFAFRPRNDPRFYGGNFPFIQTGDISEANGIIRKYSQTLNEDGFKISKLFKKGTIVISIAGNIGDVGILDFDSCFPDSIVGIKANSEKTNHLFLMYLLQKFKSGLDSIAPRSTQKNINLGILETFKLPLPSLPEQQKIAGILSTVDERLELLRKRKERLKRTKKGLMNDLLNGKRRVRV